MPMITCEQFARSQVYTAYRKLKKALYGHARVQGCHHSPLGKNGHVTSTPRVLRQKRPLATVTAKKDQIKLVQHSIS